MEKWQSNRKSFCIEIVINRLNNLIFFLLSSSDNKSFISCLGYALPEHRKLGGHDMDGYSVHCKPGGPESVAVSYKQLACICIK